jgi:hypothetical protein
LIAKCRKNKIHEGINCSLVCEIIVVLSYRLSLDIVEHVALRSIYQITATAASVNIFCDDCLYFTEHTPSV